MNDDLISRQDAIEAFEKALTIAESNGKYVTIASAVGFTGAKHILEELPSIDAVPVVRCKDCKWYGRVDKRRFYRGSDCLQKRIDTIVPERDFCSRGERKES